MNEMVDVKSEAAAVVEAPVNPRDRYTMEIKFSRNPRAGENAGEVKFHTVAPDLDLAGFLAAERLQTEVLLKMCDWGDEMAKQLGIVLPGSTK